MNRRNLAELTLTGLVLASQLAAAQAVPGLGSSVQNAIERQVERQVEQAQNSAIERAAGQAQDSVLERVVEQAQNSAVERAAGQAQDSVLERVVEQARNTAVERTVEQAAATAGELVQQRAEAAQAEIVGNQTLERVQDQVGSQVGSQIENQVGRAQSFAADQVQTPIERLPERAAERAQQAVQVTAQLDTGVAQTITDTAPAGIVGAQASDATTLVPALEPRAFVEITLEPGVRAIASEWIMFVTPEERARLNEEAAELLRYLTDAEPFTLTDGEMLTFTVPPDLDANDAILQLVPDTMRELIDRNHVYDTQAQVDETMVQSAVKKTRKKSRLQLPMPAVCDDPVTLGMIDSGIDTAHPAFAASRMQIYQRSFVDAAVAQPPAHGTAVAGMLVGRDDSGQSGAVLRPLLPAGTLYSAAVFHEQESAQGATVMRVLEALDWLLQQPDVKVVNMSLAGPPNRLLARALTAAAAKGKVVVAAVGNDGPYGPVRYPAAYDEAIGVTAVARNGEVFRFANHGEHIDYAALGVDVPTARGDGGFGTETGTSLAAPVVAAFIACALAQYDDPAEALAALDRYARDLGEHGPDPVYGRGLLHP